MKTKKTKYFKYSMLCLIAGITVSILFVSSSKDAANANKPLPTKQSLNWVAPDQAAAIERAHQKVPFVLKVSKENLSQRRQRLVGKLTPSDADFRYYWLDSPIIKKSNDLYQPVRFMHNKHMQVTGDCVTCHHYRPEADNANEVVRCSACHQQAFNKKAPERPGLKAAYHLRCAGCHEEMKQGPTNCKDCHQKNVPDHSKLVQLPPNPKPQEVTKECIRCHQSAADGLITSAHWLWRGPSTNTQGHEKEVSNGKATNTMNNFCIALANNWPRCTSCHVGYGWKDDTFDFSDTSKMDCLVCHDTTGTYKKPPKDAGMPAPDLDLVKIAKNVGHPSRQTCGDCHFEGGGGDAVKHADMNSTLYYPNRNCDVHMGGYDFQCHECHSTQNHHIRGRSTSLPVAEGGFTCEACHTEKPHHENELLDFHLNKHTQTIACNTCHVPVYAKCMPTKTFWDWSKAGDKSRKPVKDKYGKNDYFWKKGEFKWKETAKPEYAWFNGKVQRYLLGDKIESMNQTLHLTAPVGSFKDPKSKIHPFKVMRGNQPADPQTKLLLAPHLFGKGGYWKTLDWDQSFKSGMASRGLTYSGQYTWISTEMYWLINHEVTPRNMALSCANCHGSLKSNPGNPRTCNRCHQDNRDLNFNELATKGIDFKWLKSRGRDVGNLIDSTDYIHFKSLGYKGDPVIYGGRFKRLPLGWKD